MSREQKNFWRADNPEMHVPKDPSIRSMIDEIHPSSQSVMCPTVCQFGAWRPRTKPAGMRRAATFTYAGMALLSRGIKGSIVVDAFIPAPSRSHVHVRRHNRHIFPPCRQDIVATTNAGWERRAKRGGDGDDDRDVPVYYNDDAFGLVFLTASLVVRDFSFAAAFLLLSAIAATLSNANVADIKSTPILPGVIAFAALAASKIEPFAFAAQSLGGDFVVPLDEQGSQIELIVCSISLVWCIIQQVRSAPGTKE